MISQQDADTVRDFHYCSPLDPTKCYRFRRNGQTKRWKRTPQRFAIPAKFGLYTYRTITNLDDQNFHVPEDCPNKSRFGFAVPAE